MLEYCSDDVTSIYLSGDSYPADDRIRLALQARLNIPLLSQSDLPSLRNHVPGNLNLRMKALEIYLDILTARRVFLFGRSSGARVVTEVALNRAYRHRIVGIIALGYPFRHPDRPIEPARYEHLPRLDLPCLFAHGCDDQYGAANTLSCYELPLASSVISLSCDHTMLLTERSWDHLAAQMATFMNTCMGTPSVHPTSAHR